MIVCSRSSELAAELLQVKARTPEERLDLAVRSVYLLQELSERLMRISSSTRGGRS